MSLLKSIKHKYNIASEIIGDKYHKTLRKYTVNRKNRRRLKNTEFSIISNDCTGAIMFHDLGVRFNSPFVNLWLYPEDFIKYCENMEYYNSQELNFDVFEDGVTYPIGRLDDIRIYFMHYHTSEEATNKWNERRQRINKDNLFFCMDDRNGCTTEHMRWFDQLPYEKKILLTNKKVDFKCAFYVKGFEKESCVGVMSDFVNCLSPRRYYDQFDYIGWINEKNRG